MNKRTIIKANPDYYRVSWYHDENGGWLSKDPIIAWEVEYATDEEYQDEREGLYALPVCMEDASGALTQGVLTPNGSVCVVCHCTYPDITFFIADAKKSFESRRKIAKQ